LIIKSKSKGLSSSRYTTQRPSREFDIMLIEYQMKQEGVNLSLVNYQGFNATMRHLFHLIHFWDIVGHFRKYHTLGV